LPLLSSGNRLARLLVHHHITSMAVLVSDRKGLEVNRGDATVHHHSDSLEGEPMLTKGLHGGDFAGGAVAGSGHGWLLAVALVMF